jgi:hypothetical protein
MPVMGETYSDVSVVMGTRNEERAIRKVITDIQKGTCSISCGYRFKPTQYSKIINSSSI